MTEAGPTEVSVTDPDELAVVGGGGGRAPICFVVVIEGCRRVIVVMGVHCGQLWLVQLS